MFFRKNKIATQINKNNDSTLTSSDFDSLNVVKENRKSKKFYQRVIVKQYEDGKENIKQKYHSSKTFLHNKAFDILKWTLIILLIVSFIIGCFIAYSSHFFPTPGDIAVPINNFYMAKENGIVGLTGFGISFVVLLVLLLIAFVSYVLWAKKKNVLFNYTNKKLKVSAIVAMVLIIVAMVLVTVIVVVPPPLKSLHLDSNLQYYLSQGYNGDIAAIKKAYEIIGKQMPTGSNDQIIQKFKDDVINGVFAQSNSTGDSHSIVQDLYFYTSSTISVVGLVLIVFIVTFFIVGLFIIPFVNLLLGIKIEVALGNDVKENWNSFKIFIYKKFSNSKRKVFEQIKDYKEKDSYRKYKKEMKEKGVEASSRAEERFNTENVDNQKVNVISIEEIESHEPNKAFLNNQGQWMYHDGEHNYFVVKNDEWVEFDPNAAIHTAHVNVNTNREDGEMSKRAKKESKFFKNREKIEKAINKDSVSIDLPDEDLDKIIKELDI